MCSLAPASSLSPSPNQQNKCTLMIASISSPDSLLLTVKFDEWLGYAFSAIPDHIVSSSIIIVATLVLFFVVAILGGLCWNKQWSLSKNNRWFIIGVLAVVAAAGLAAGDALCGGNFNSFTGGYNNVTSAFNNDPIDPNVSPEAYDLVSRYVKFSQISCSEPYAVSEDSVAHHDNARCLLMYVPLICLLLIGLVVSWVSCADIRVISALDSKN